ncbi:MAG: hypothetical protein N2589_04630 [bacterium]|nr:hypothetical protein [bacterium]
MERHNEENTHTHFDCKKEIAVVHNGIIENYQFLKEELIKKGHTFISQTDTEIIPHLVEEKLKKEKNIILAIFSVLKQLEGSFALLLTQKNNDFIIGARKNSPLLVGFDGKNFYFSSDPIAIAKYTKKMIFLDENELFIIDSKIKFYNFEKEIEINKKFQKLSIDYINVSKERYDTYMLKEIYEQPKAI